MPKYIEFNTTTGEIIGVRESMRGILPFTGDLPIGRNLIRNGQVVPAPDIVLSLCATHNPVVGADSTPPNADNPPTDAETPPSGAGTPPSAPPLSDETPPYGEFVIDKEPIIASNTISPPAGEPFFLDLTFPDSFPDSPPAILNIELTNPTNRTKTAFRWRQGASIKIDSPGDRIIKITGPAPWQSNPISFTVTEAANPPEKLSASPSLPPVELPEPPTTGGE